MQKQKIVLNYSTGGFGPIDDAYSETLTITEKSI